MLILGLSITLTLNRLSNGLPLTFLCISSKFLCSFVRQSISLGVDISKYFFPTQKGNRKHLHSLHSSQGGKSGFTVTQNLHFCLAFKRTTAFIRLTLYITIGCPPPPPSQDLGIHADDLYM